ncbi:response regulator [Pontimicrobium aquaticum]|uniref:histidine kinase n=1 Tax=Pontimicrobium aquaticum TaxID=2565367 RepID=A0A4U0EK77_9FLAO|nr:response regulator [Pontimicrobium aquaticum]TJY31845.1 response regulator [Pontimicrobium aquaticum]
MNLFNSIKKKGVYIPIVAFVVISALITTIWYKLTLNYNQDTKEDLVQIGKITSQKFQSILNYDIEALENLKMRLEFTNGQYFDYWEKDALLILEQNPSFNFIEWIDSNMIIKKIVPAEGNESALNLDISKIEYRKKEWIEHTESRQINITPWSKMTQGGYAFLIDIPVYYNNQLQGTITAGMDFTSHIDNFTKSLNEYKIEISDYDGTIFYGNKLQEAETNKFLFEKSILIDELHSKYWGFKMYPTNAVFLSYRAMYIKYFFTVGIIVAFLIALLFYFYLRAKDEVKRTINSNNALLKTNKKLNAEQIRAEKASKAKSEFLSNMSHEIRTPLHAILGFVQILKSSNLNKTDKKHVHLLDKSSKSLLSIVNDILTIDKIESGTIQLEESFFSPSETIKELTDTYRHLFTQKNLYLNTEFVNPYGLVIKGDQNKLSQIVINIIKNASKFTVKGGVLVLYSEEQVANSLKVNITIKDTGIGIHKNQINTIFNRFAQIDSSLKKQHEGSGLGLAISKDLAEKLGGTITVKSIEGKGTTFEISVAFKIVKKKSNNTIEGYYENINLSHLTALIVDDNRINIAILKKILAGINIKVDTAFNGKEAVEKVKANSYNMVFMDIHMPEMDGFEATQIIRSFNSSLKIFGLSANVTTEAINKAFDSGMNNYITKPFTKEQLYNLILISLEYSELNPKTDFNNLVLTQKSNSIS